MINLKNIFKRNQLQSYIGFQALQLSRKKDIKNIVWFIFQVWIIAHIIFFILCFFGSDGFFGTIDNFLSPEGLIYYIYYGIFITGFSIFIAIDLVSYKEEFPLQMILFLLLGKGDEYFSNEIHVFANFYKNYIYKKYPQIVISKSNVQVLHDLNSKGIINSFETVINNLGNNFLKYKESISALEVITGMKKSPSYTNTAFIIKLKKKFFKENLENPVVIQRKSFKVWEYFIMTCMFFSFLGFIGSGLTGLFSSEEEVFVFFIVNLFGPYKYITIITIFLCWLWFLKLMMDGKMRKIVTANKLLKKFEIKSHDQNFQGKFINDIHAEKIQKFYKNCPLGYDITMYIFNEEIYMNLNIKKYVGNWQRLLRFFKALFANYSIRFDTEYIDKKIETIKYAEEVFGSKTNKN